MNLPSHPHQQTAAAAQPTPSDRPERKPWEQLLIGLEDQVLLDCYHDAVEMKLEEDFIELLKKEIELRGIGDRMIASEGLFVEDLQNA